MYFRPMPDLERLKATIRYDASTGDFYRYRKTYKRWDKMFTNLKPDPRHRPSISFEGTRYLCHRLAYYLMTGKDPGEMFVDHIDGDGQNNRWSNLRCVTAAENCHNRKTYSKSGHKGIYPYIDKNGVVKSYAVQVCRTQGKGPRGEKYSRDGYRRKTVTLGRFKTLEEAKQCYIDYIYSQGLQRFAREGQLTPVGEVA